MRKLLTAGLAALTLGGSVLATTAPAQAAPFHGFNGGFHNGYRGGFRGRGIGPGGVLAAGVIGLALGAAISHPYYGPGPYAYGPGPYYGDPYEACYAPRQIWDPYVGHYVIERVRYAC